MFWKRRNKNKRRDPAPSHPRREYDLHEFFADEFAMMLLMPPEEFQALQGAGHSDYYIAKHFGVTVPRVKRWAERLARNPYDPGV